MTALTTKVSTASYIHVHHTRDEETTAPGLLQLSFPVEERKPGDEDS